MDALVDNQAVVQAWNNRSGKSEPLNKALKRLFFTTMDLNVSLDMLYISTNDNPADSHSRRLWIANSVLPYGRLLGNNSEVILVTPAT